MTTDPANRLPIWLALPTAIASGFVLAAAFPGTGWWPLAFVGVAMLLASLMGQRVPESLLIGFAGGLTFYLVHVAWTSLYLGPVPWIALSILQALFFAVGAALIALAYRLVPRVWGGTAGRLVLLPVVVAGLWTVREAVASSWPYGGFAWGRLVLSQSESPFAPLTAWIGFSGVSFVVAFVAAVLVQCAWSSRSPTRWRAAVAIGTVALVLAVPTWPSATSGTVSVGAVQGNGKAGYFDRREPGDVLRSQLDATRPLLGEKVDMLVWPEGANDIDPTRSSDVAKALDQVSRAFDAPLVTNTVTVRDDKYYNTSLVWHAGEGVTGSYDKRHPVPFGEYVPDRSFWEPFAPELIGLIQRDYTPGTRPNVLDVGGVRAGFAICFDIVDDQLATDMVYGEAQLILAQTNNADFGRTDENEQQLAIARLRAIELGRSLVNISTVGSSQILAPDGRTIAHIPPYVPGHMIADVPLATGLTPAAILSRGVEVFVSGLALAVLLTAAWESSARRRRDR